jgi:hypothetical protein
MTVANQAPTPMGPVMGGANIRQQYLRANLIDGGRTVRRTS